MNILASIALDWLVHYFLKPSGFSQLKIKFSVLDLHPLNFCKILRIFFTLFFFTIKKSHYFISILACKFLGRTFWCIYLGTFIFTYYILHLYSWTFKQTPIFYAFLYDLKIKVKLFIFICILFENSMYHLFTVFRHDCVVVFKV